MRFFVQFSGAILTVALMSHANCGLDYCPRLSSKEKPVNNSASLLVKSVAFNLDSASGYYQELLARYEYSGIHGWVFGGNVPIVALTVQSETRFGISNPLLYASWYGHLDRTGMIYLGTQLELPFGNADEAMASDHLMLVPYVLIEQSFGASSVLGGIGYSHAFALHKHEEGAEHPLYVNPHEDQEFLYRVGTGFRIWNGKLTPQISLSGSHALVEELEGAGRDHVTVGIATACDLGHNLTLTPSAEFPVTSPKRFDWNAGLEIKSLF